MKTSELAGCRILAPVRLTAFGNAKHHKPALPAKYRVIPTLMTSQSQPPASSIAISLWLVSTTKQKTRAGTWLREVLRRSNTSVDVRRINVDASVIRSLGPPPFERYFQKPTVGVRIADH